MGIRERIRAIVITAAAVAVVDGIGASALAVAVFGSSSGRMFQGIASTLMGKEAYTDGALSVAAGMVMHVIVACLWSTLFIGVIERSSVLKRWLRSVRGMMLCAGIIGPVIWCIMSIAVIPLLLQRPPQFGERWVIQFFAHIPFVGLPLVITASRTLIGPFRSSSPS